MVARRVVVVVVVFAATVGHAIKLYVDSRQRCITENFWQAERVRGSFKWTNPSDADVSVEARDLDLDRTLFSSGRDTDSFQFTTNHMQFCFSQVSRFKCVGWRQTGECNPHGPREPGEDRDCTTTIPSGASGYCECLRRTQPDEPTGPENVFFACEHEPLRCAEVCSVGVKRTAVLFDFAVGDAAVDTGKLATTDTVNQAQYVVNSVRSVLNQVQTEVKGATEAEQEHSEALERGNSLMVWMHVVTLVVFVLCMGVQLLLFFRMFKQHNLV